MSTVDEQNTSIKREADPSKTAPSNNDVKGPSPPRPDQPNNPTKTEGANHQDTQSSTTNAQPLAPPPKPSQQNASETPDYFSGGHNGSHFSLEPNPFEQSFGNPAETPGKFGGLPSVASLTSPAPIGPGGTPGSNWQNSLRSGPLSPAMLPGPAPSNGYFDESFRGSFPTPNESSLRTGLTPGAGGSIFPAPSPNSQAIFTSLQNGGATPGTLEFQRAAITAAARSKADANNSNNNASSTANANTTTNEVANNNNQSMSGNNSGVNKQEYQPAQQQQSGPQDPFSNHPESEAVNSLYMLANNGNNNRNNQFAVPNQQHNINAQAAQMQPRMQENSGSAEGAYDGDTPTDNKSGSRSKGKKGAKASQASNGRRRPEETPTKIAPNKRMKGSDGMPVDMDDEDGDDMSMDGDGQEMSNITASGRKMTDEEKRKNFLERNRVAALKCRQRKKQWLANLQTKVEIFTSENDALSAQCTQLREEIMNLKTLLLAHKDCPVSHQQGIAGATMSQVIGDFSPPTNNYGMPMGNGQQMIGMPPGQGMHRG